MLGFSFQISVKEQVENNINPKIYPNIRYIRYEYITIAPKYVSILQNFTKFYQILLVVTQIKFYN